MKQFAAVNHPTLVPLMPLAPTAAQPHLPPRITIVLPGLTFGGVTGGSNTAYNIGARLHLAGLRVRFATAGVMDANLGNLRTISPRVFAAPATVDEIATELIRAATATEAGETNTPLPAGASEMPPTWAAALSEVVPWIVAGVRESRHA